MKNNVSATRASDSALSSSRSLNNSAITIYSWIYKLLLL